jgi:hypothetical protein
MTNETDSSKKSPKIVVVGGDRGWAWLPTLNGALRRELVTAVTVQRIDGDFKGGYKAMWTLHVNVSSQTELVELRPHFFEASELTSWIDRVFPGASFGLLAPKVISEGPQRSVPVEDTQVMYVSGATIANAIREIGEGLAGGDDGYQIDAARHPLPGAPPIAQ